MKDAYSEDVRNELKEKLNSFIPNIMNMNNDELKDELLPKMNELLASLDLIVTSRILPTKTDEIAVGLVIDTDPLISEIGIGTTIAEAMCNVILKLINKIKFLIT